jgi:hypothetical protein
MREGLREVSRTIAQVGIVLGDDTEAPDDERAEYYERADGHFPFQVVDEDGPDGTEEAAANE